jgi:hypothetical protein
MNILTWISKNEKLIFLSIIVVLCLFLYKGCLDKAHLESTNLQATNNILAMNDSVRIEKTKNGELQFVKSALVTDMKNLKDMNIELYNEVKNQKKAIFYISQMTSVIKDDIKKQSNDDIAYKDPSTGADIIKWNFDTINDNWSRILNGKSYFTVKYDTSGKYTVKPSYSVIDTLKQTMKLTTGLKASETKKDMLEIFIKSSYPGMTFTEIDGAIINPEDFKKYLPKTKPKPFAIGPYVGLGYGITLKNTPQLVPVFNVGIGVQYKIINF